MSQLGGVSVFVPVSQLERKEDRTWWTEEEMSRAFIGQEISVAIMEVSPAEKKVVCSVLKGIENEKIRKIEVGSVIQGTVRRIEPFGVFVGISGTKVSGLLHISNISRNHIEHPKTVFEIGETISCVVMGLDENYANLSLSTAELEQTDGDILQNKAFVWAHARTSFCYVTLSKQFVTPNNNQIIYFDTAEEQGEIFKKSLKESMHVTF